MSKFFQKLTAMLLVPLMAAGSVVTAAAENASVDEPAASEPQSITVEQSRETESVELQSEVVEDTSTDPDPEIPCDSSGEENIAVSGDSLDQNGIIGDLNWKYDASKKTLTISGAGELVRDDSIKDNWKTLDIEKLVIEYGVTAVTNQSLIWLSFKEISLPETLTLIGYHSFGRCEYLESITIPDSVTTIEEGAFAYCTALKNIKLPRNIKAIAKDTFMECKGLESITLPDSVESIGEHAFRLCESLRDVNIPAKVKAIEDSTFNCCYALESITIPSSVTSIGMSAFGSSGLKSVTLPESVEKIGNSAFGYCRSLVSISFPSKLTVIPDSVLGDCPNLKNVIIPEGVTRIGKCAFSGTFASCGIEEITLPSTLESIGASAFAGCDSLSSIVIPGLVTSIESGAFKNCKSLSSVTLPASITEIGESAFSGSGLASVVIPPQVTVISPSVFENCKSLESMTIPAGVTEIQERAFSGCGIKSITLPQTLTSIGDRAFSGCGELTAIVLPDSVTSVEGYVFSECKSLESAVISGSLTEISYAMFSECTNLSDVYIPQSVTKIGDQAFWKTKLASVNIPDTVTEIGGSAFSFCTELKSFVVPPQVTEVSTDLFNGCTSLESVTIHEGVTAIGGGAFEKSALESITLPSTVTSIGKLAFYECRNLKSIVIPQNVTTISDWIFYDCSSLESVTLPEGITAIGESAFTGCTFEKITLPGTITSIGRNAFYSCKNLRGVTLNDPNSGNLTEIGEYAFNGCKSLNIIYIPESVTMIGEDAFKKCAENFIIQCKPGSYAQEYAENNNILYEFLVSDSTGVLIVNAGEEYVGQHVRLTDEETGRVYCSRYINNKRIQICGIDPDITYKAEIVSDKNSVFAARESIKLVNDLAEISFSDGKSVCGITLVVKNGSGADFTDSCRIKWFAESGEYLGMGNTLKNVAKGESFRYTVEFKYNTLSENYYVPDERTVKADSADTKAELKLEDIASRILTGKAADENGTAIKGASVSLTQTFGENHEKTTAAVTDADGLFMISAKDVPSSVIIKKQGFVMYSETFESLPEDELSVTLNKTEMAAIELNVTKAELDSETVTPLTGAFDLTVKNTSTGKEVEDFYILNTQLMLPLNEVGKNDYVKITAECEGCETKTAEFRLSQDTPVSIEFIPYGELKVVQKNADSNESAVMLFSDYDSRCVSVLNLKKQTVTSDSLPDGSYTVIMMNKSARYSAPGTLSDFEKFGLEENKDYIKTKDTIEKGKTTVLEDVVIPVLDANKASIFDKTGTSVKVNKSSVTLGQYVVFNVKYSLKDSVNAEDLKLELSIPSESLKPNKNGITINGKIIDYYGSSELTIPLTERSGCVIIALKAVKVTDSCVVTAGLSFKNDSMRQNETIGSETVAIKGLYLYVPALTPNTTVSSYGTTLPNKKVEYYDNGTLVGTTYSNYAGDYTISFELADPRTHSYHEIYAVINTDDGQFRSGSRYIEYLSGAVIPERVDVYGAFGGHDEGKIMSVNFLSAEDNDLHYMYYDHLNFSVIYTNRFTYEVFFSGDVSKVSYAAVLTTSSSGEITRVPLTLDEERGVFVASRDYRVENRPASISVDYKAEQVEIIDYEDAYSEADELYSKIGEYNEAAQKMNEAAAEIEEASVIKKDEMVSCLKEYGFTDETLAALDLDELLEAANADLQDFITQMSQNGDEACSEEIAKLDKCFEELNALYEERGKTTGVYTLDESVTAEQLIKEGYKPIKTFDSKGQLFERGSESNEYDFIDLTRRYAMVYPAQADTGKNPNTSGSQPDISASGTCSCCSHRIIDPITMSDVALDIANMVKPAAKLLTTLLTWIENFQKSQLGFINSVNDTLGNVFPDGLGNPDDISNPQLRTLAQKLVGNVFENKYVQKTLKFNAAVQSVLAPLQAVCEGIIALTDLGEISEMIERLAPRLCTCTTYSNNRVEWAINDLHFQLAAIAFDVTACSIPEFNSFYDLAKSGWKGLFKGLGKLKLIDENTVKSFTDPFAYGRQKVKASLINAERFLTDCKCDNDNNTDENGIRLSSGVDPSGYICEAVASNRVEGVTTTLWYSENEDGTDAVIWDASEWSQENPLISDENGHYEWYVPEGWWQVEFEKEGYEKTYSEWVPVLPIQTEINVSMKSLHAPEVKSAAVYKDSVYITFTQYMDLYSVTTDTVKVTQGGKELPGRIEPLNAEESFDSSRVKYASKFRFIPDAPLDGEVSITADKVKSYNGLYIDTAYQTTAKAIERVEKIDAPERVVVKFDETSNIEIQLLPQSVAANTTVTVTANAGDDIITLGSTTVKADECGKAVVTITGKLPANVELTFSIPDSDISAVTTVVLSEDPDSERQDIGNLGDLDGDGEITANDALTVLRASVGTADLTPEQTLLADIDGDGQITANDALSLLRYSVGMGEEDSPINKPISA